MLSKELLDELKEILKENCGVNLDSQTLLEVGNTLVGFFELLIEASSAQKQILKHE